MQITTAETFAGKNGVFSLSRNPPLTRAQATSGVKTV